MKFKELKNGQAFEFGYYFLKIDEDHVFSINLSEKQVSSLFGIVAEKTIHLEWDGDVKEVFAPIVKSPGYLSIFNVKVNPDANVSLPAHSIWLDNEQKLYNYVKKFVDEIIDLI